MRRDGGIRRPLTQGDDGDRRSLADSERSTAITPPSVRSSDRRRGLVQPPLFLRCPSPSAGVVEFVSPAPRASDLAYALTTSAVSRETVALLVSFATPRPRWFATRCIRRVAAWRPATTTLLARRSVRADPPGSGRQLPSPVPNSPFWRCLGLQIPAPRLSPDSSARRYPVTPFARSRLPRSPTPPIPQSPTSPRALTACRPLRATAVAPCSSVTVPHPM